MHDIDCASILELLCPQIFSMVCHPYITIIMVEGKRNATFTPQANIQVLKLLPTTTRDVGSTKMLGRCSLGSYIHSTPHIGLGSRREGEFGSCGEWIIVYMYVLYTYHNQGVGHCHNIM